MDPKFCIFRCKKYFYIGEEPFLFLINKKILLPYIKILGGRIEFLPYIYFLYGGPFWTPKNRKMRLEGIYPQTAILAKTSVVFKPKMASLRKNAKFCQIGKFGVLRYLGGRGQ